MSPAELLMGRQIHLDLVHPNLADQVEVKQETQEMYHDRHAKDHTFSEGDPVFVKEYRFCTIRYNNKDTITCIIHCYVKRWLHNKETCGSYKVQNSD